MQSVCHSDRDGAATVVGVPAVPIGNGVVLPCAEHASLLAVISGSAPKADTSAADRAR